MDKLPSRYNINEGKKGGKTQPHNVVNASKINKELAYYMVIKYGGS